MIAPGGAVQFGRLVDDHGRIARPGDDGPLGLLHGGPGHGRPAGNADQGDVAMLEEGLGRLQRRLDDHANQVVDAQVAIDGLVEAADAFGRDLLAAGMRIDDQRVAAGDHAHGVAGDRGQRVRDRRDRADDAEGGVLDHRQAVIAAEDFAAEELHAQRPLAQRLELLDLVLQAADLRLFHLHRAQLDALLDRDAADVPDDAAAIVDRHAAESVRTPRGRRPRRWARR